MKAIRPSAWLVSLGWLALGPGLLHAQGLFFVTGLSPAGGATVTADDGTAFGLSVGRPVGRGTVVVADGANLMLFTPPGAVAVALGPAAFDLSRDEIRRQTQIELRAGKLSFTAGEETATGDGVIEVSIAAADPGDTGAPHVDFQVAPGHILVHRAADRIAIAFAPTSADQLPASIAVNVNSKPTLLPAGQLLVVDAAGTPNLMPLGDWLQAEGFAREWGRELGVGAAQEFRTEVEADLFNNIIAWDRYAGARYVVPRLAPPRFNIEIRQTIQTITVPARPSTRGGAIETQPFPGANEVPAVSPAAASVQNLRDVGGGITAILLNRNASQLLTGSGSQGLGFEGLRQLSIPGRSGGVPTAGPSGLGSQP